MTARRQAALAFIFVTVLLDMLALGLIAPVLADLVGPGLFTLTFAHFIRAQGNGDRPGAPFLLAAGLQVAALAIAWWVTRPRPAAAPAAT